MLLFTMLVHVSLCSKCVHPLCSCVSILSMRSQEAGGTVRIKKKQRIIKQPPPNARQVGVSRTAQNTATRPTAEEQVAYCVFSLCVCMRTVYACVYTQKCLHPAYWRIRQLLSCVCVCVCLPVCGCLCVLVVLLFSMIVHVRVCIHCAPVCLLCPCTHRRQVTQRNNGPEAKSRVISHSK